MTAKKHPSLSLSSCTEFAVSRPSGAAAISTPSKFHFCQHMQIAFCGAWLAIALTGCGSSYSSNKTSPPGASAPALWVANGANVLEFNLTVNSQLSPPVYSPTLVLNSSAFGNVQGVVFDASGNLWVVDGGNLNTHGGNISGPALYQFTSANLATLQSPATGTPNITIASSAFRFPQQAAFDSKGDLWVSDSGANAIVEFLPAQLMASGSAVTPSLTLQSNPAFNSGYGRSTASTLGIAFDAAGDLWVANNGNSKLYEFNAASLAAASGSVTLPPAVVLSDDGKQSIAWPWGLAFDSTGNLWVSNAGYFGLLDNLIAPVNTVVEFPKASLTAIGSPTPAVILTSTTVNGNPSLNFPEGMTFDSSGGVAVANSASPFGVSLYGSTQLMTGGAIAPFTLIGSATAFKSPAGVTFGPLITYGSAGTYGGTMY